MNPTPQGSEKDWRDMFDSIVSGTKYDQDSNNRFCCGGDYCMGDHNEFIKEFIEQVEATETARIVGIIKSHSWLESGDWPTTRGMILEEINAKADLLNQIENK